MIGIQDKGNMELGISIRAKRKSLKFIDNILYIYTNMVLGMIALDADLKNVVGDTSCVFLNCLSLHPYIIK